MKIKFIYGNINHLKYATEWHLLYAIYNVVSAQLSLTPKQFHQLKRKPVHMKHSLPLKYVIASVFFHLARCF